MVTEFYILPELAIEIGFRLLDNKEEINNLLNDLLKYLRTSFDIIVFGIASTGKTTMGNFVNGKTTFMDLAIAERSINLEFFKFEESTNRIVNFIVTPGEERHEQANLIKFQEIIAQKKPFGLINVVSYGYQFPKNLSYQEVVSEDKPLEDYLKERREMEIKSIEKLLPHIKTARNLSWMLTLVTKQDLWWDKRDEVKNYYQNGDYAKVITELKQVFGEHKPFIHEYISTSFVSLNVYSNDRKRIAAVVEGYDSAIQAAHWEQFIKTLNHFKKTLESQVD